MIGPTHFILRNTKEEYALWPSAEPVPNGWSLVTGTSLHRAKLELQRGWLTARRPSRFKSRPDDVLIASYPRSGTTWLQMLLYQMVGTGDLDIEHISTVSPFLENALSDGHDLERWQTPRLIKTHKRYSELAEHMGRVVFVHRDGRDVATSYYAFYTNYLGYEGSFADFFDAYLAGEVQYGSWFEHTRDWLNAQNDPRVLVVRYEDLVADLRTAILAIGTFLGVPLDSADLDRIAARSSFQFMKAHEALFDHANEVLLRLGVRRGKFLRRGVVGNRTSFVTTAQDNKFRQLSAVFGLPSPSMDGDATATCR